VEWFVVRRITLLNGEMSILSKAKSSISLTNAEPECGTMRALTFFEPVWKFGRKEEFKKYGLL
jgi:hypothetical protein